MADIKESTDAQENICFYQRTENTLFFFALSNSHQAKNSLEFRSLFSDRGKEGLQTELFQYQDLKHNSQSSMLF